MERVERLRLQTIRRHLEEDLERIDALLATASRPKRRSSADIKDRAAKICQAIRARGGSVSRDVLKELINKHGFPFHAVGALFSGTYLRADGKNIGLGKRGLAVVGKGSGRVAPSRRTKRRTL